MQVMRLHAVARHDFLLSAFVTASSTVQWEMMNSDAMVVISFHLHVIAHKTNSLHLSEERHPRALRAMTDVTAFETVLMGKMNKIVMLLLKILEAIW